MYPPPVLSSLRIIACLVLLLLAACGRQSGAPESATRQTKGVIGLSVLTLTNPFFKEIADKMTEEAAKHGYTVSVVSGEFDVARQQNQVKDFIVQKVAAIVLTPCDSKAIGPAIQNWPFLIRNSAFNVVVVACLTWLAMPLLTRIFHSWLHSQERKES